MIGKEETTLHHILGTANITATAIVICTEAAPDHSTKTDTAIIEVAQDSPTPYIGNTATDPAMTLHTGHTPHITVIQTTTLETTAEHIAAHLGTTLKTTVDHAHDHPTNHQSTGHTKRDCTAQYHISTMETTSPT